MDEIVKDLVPLLQKEGIKYREHGTRIRVPLPNGFGELEIGDLDKGDTIVGLVGETWHTHGEILKYEQGGDTEAEAICLFIKGIFEGKYFLIQELEGGKPIRRTIEDDLNRFHKNLPQGVEVKIYNET